MKLHNTALKPLYKKSKKGHRGFPLATVAFYGPSNTKATKIVVSIIEFENSDPTHLEKWFSEQGDIRTNPIIGREVSDYVKAKNITSVVITDRIIGCPHEEGIDYPEDSFCPNPGCEYWVGRNRFSHKVEH